MCVSTDKYIFVYIHTHEVLCTTYSLQWYFCNSKNPGNNLNGKLYNIHNWISRLGQNNALVYMCCVKKFF